MKKPYLIQRAKFCNDQRETAKGIDKLLQFDYMGSAEFEWGALPESLKRVRENFSDYVHLNYFFKKYHPTKFVNVFCRKAQKDFIGDILEELSENKIRLKEYCDLKYYLEDDIKWRHNDFWWDIEQDWFFWRPSVDFDNKFKETLSKSK